MGQEEGTGDRSRVLAYRDAGGVRLIIRGGYDFSDRFALARGRYAVLPARSCVVDGEAIACDENGLSVFDLLRYQRTKSFCVRDATGQAPLLAGGVEYRV